MGECISSEEAHKLLEIRRLESQRKTLKGRRQKKSQRVSDMALIATEAILTQRKREIRWRSKQSVYCRQILAWLFNFAVFGVALLLSLVYAGLFGNQATTKMVIQWAVAYGW